MFSYWLQLFFSSYNLNSLNNHDIQHIIFVFIFSNTFIIFTKKSSLYAGVELNFLDNWMYINNKWRKHMKPANDKVRESMHALHRTGQQSPWGMWSYLTLKVKLGSCLWFWFLFTHWSFGLLCMKVFYIDMTDKQKGWDKEMRIILQINVYMRHISKYVCMNIGT